MIVFKQTKLIFIVSLVALLLALVAFFIGIRYSVPVMAEMYAWTIAILIIIYTWIVAFVSPVNIARLLMICFFVVLPLSIATGVAALFRAKFTIENSILSSLIVGIVFVSSYSMSILTISDFRFRLREVKNLFFLRNK